MKGLIIKDFLNLKRQAGVIIAIIAIYLAIGLLGNNVSMIVSMLMIIAAMLPLTALSYDERAKWDKFALTMPITRKQAVAAKYVFAIILIGGASVVSLIAMLMSESMSLQEGVITFAIFIAISFTFVSLLLPAGFKFGVEKARYIMILAFLIPFLAFIAYAKLNETVGFGIQLTEQRLVTGAWIGVPVAAVCFVISYCISVKVYENKEF